MVSIMVKNHKNCRKYNHFMLFFNIIYFKDQEKCGNSPADGISFKQ